MKRADSGKNTSKFVFDVRPPRRKAEISPQSSLLKTPAVATVHYGEEGVSTVFRPKTVEVKKEKNWDGFLVKIGNLRRRTFGKRRSLKKLAAVLLAVLVVFFGLLVFSLKSAGGELVVIFREVAGNFKAAAENFSGFNSRESLKLLSENSLKLKKAEEVTGRSGAEALVSLSGVFLPQLRGALGIIGDVSELNNSAAETAVYFEKLAADGLLLATSGRGEELIGLVAGLNGALKNLGNSSSKVRNNLTGLEKNFGGAFPDSFLNLNGDYFGYISEIYRAEKFSSSFLKILENYGDQHFLLFFQNPSEIRPGGGFIGSYADITLNRGSIAGIDVRDIYDPDGQLDLKVVPPKPLSIITKSWGARDANWFFDFNDSARKVIEFLENSKMYRERFVKFEGVLAINVNVIEDFLSVAGPVELKDYDLVLTADNFLLEVEKEVRVGKGKLQGEPKRILKSLAPILLERLKNLTEEQKSFLTDKLFERAKNKDIMVYFKDTEMESFISSAGLAGEVYNLPQGFTGDYLAVVNANIAGGKSDAFVRQEIDFSSFIGSGGEITSEIAVKRSHFGQNEKYSWWRATNQNFLKVFAPPDAILVSANGGSRKSVYPGIDYQKSGYVSDADVAAIENSFIWDKEFGVEKFKESGKAVFASWFNVSAGETRTFALKYRRLNKVALFDGVRYQFVYDKQSGVNSAIKATIKAPPGFIFEETEKPVFVLKKENTDRREIVNLTLRKLF